MDLESDDDEPEEEKQQMNQLKTILQNVSLEEDPKIQELKVLFFLKKNTNKKKIFNANKYKIKKRKQELQHKIDHNDLPEELFSKEPKQFIYLFKTKLLII